MNIFRWQRKGKYKKIPLKTIILFIFSLIMTTFAWFAYSKILNPTLNIHMASWDMEYYIGEKIPENKKTNPISVDIPILYPAMDEEKLIIDIYNNGETLVDIEYQVKSLTIVGTTYQIIQEGQTVPTDTDNYIALASSVSDTTEPIYKNVIINDITRFPFTLEIEHSKQVEAVVKDRDGNIIPGEGYLQITVNWIGDNNELDSEWGYIVGEYFANNPTATSAVSIELSIDSYQADPAGGTVVETLPTSSTTKPYLPTGFTRVAGTNLDTGLVIKDASGNEYVWVEVPKSTAVYTDAGLSITGFSADDYTAIETDLKNYAGAYNEVEDEHSSYSIIGLSEDDYDAYKKKMLKSIYQNGGFYIGRYETGIADTNPDVIEARTASGDATQTPVIQANAYPYNYVTTFQAHGLAVGMATENYTTSLMFGLQWGLTMKYLNANGTSQEMLTTDSTSWGNYSNNSFNMVNENAVYRTTAGEWSSDLPYEKESETKVLIGPGGNSTFCNQNIYDLAGNLAEWTYNVRKDETDTYYIGGNGGDYNVEGTNSATNCGLYDSTIGDSNIGFRVALYADTGISSAWGDTSGGNADPELPSVAETGPYLPTGFSWANAEHTEIADPLNNQYVWISVPRDATVYNDMDDDTEDTAMSDTSNEDILAFDVNNLTTANLTAIEKELHEYTATYRNGTTYKDEFNSTGQHGFADATAYNNHKNAMLTSVFKNGGFYVGKYETGIADTDLENIDTNHEARTASGDATQTPVIQANAYPYNFVTNKQAQELASTKFNGGEYTTSLMFGVQWDLVLKHLEVSNAATVDELNSDSTEWGNYMDNTTYSTNANGKYYKSSAWTDGAYNKTTSESVLLSTGASTEFERGGIYDLAGNVYEWTLEYTSISSSPCAVRGGYYNYYGYSLPANYRHSNPTDTAIRNYGFRVSLY